MMQSNPMMQMVGMLRNGTDPKQILMQMAQNNPQVRQVVQMMQGKTSAELRQMAINMAKEQGVNINDVLRQLGVNVPSNK